MIFGGNVSGISPTIDPRVQEALSRVWHSPRALVLADGSFALFNHRAQLMAVGLSAEELADQMRLYVAFDPPPETPPSWRLKATRYGPSGRPEIDLDELGL